MKHIKKLLLSAIACLTGFAAGAQTIDATNATVAWAFSEGASSSTSATTSTEGALSATSYSLGSKLSIGGTQAVSGQKLTLLTPKAKTNTVDEDTYITFSLTPKKGITFTPKTLTFNAAKIGTNGGALEVRASVADKATTLETGFNPERNNNGFSSKSIDLSGLGSTTDRVDITIYVYNLNGDKQLGLNNIVISGDFKGTVEKVESYTLSIASAMEAAGDLTVNPAGTSFDAGTEVSVSTTENFGYHFTSWTDAKGNVASTENPYTFNIAENTSLTANYTKNEVYALNLTLEGGANANLVQFQPAGNVTDGVHYYEAGTDVKLTAQNNRILTFTTWDDNSTSLERDVKMDGTKNITATFSASDYIVGWDLYTDSPNSERAADYKAESDNAGVLSLHNADGKTATWLANGVSKGAMNGKYCARIWRPLTDKNYFEISFSTVGYTNIKLSASVGNDYNTYGTIKAEYSTDGTTYTKFGEWAQTARAWTDGEFELPADAAGQSRLYIRFMPDWDAAMVGVSSTNDGLAVTNIFVLADKEIVDDDVAPKLVSTIPANGGEGASASGSIILNFDEKIAALTASGAGTLDGKSLTPTISGKTAVFRYTGLKYATTYTFSLPKGAIADRSGNAFEGLTLTFKTMARTQPDARLYDAIVAQDGTGDYATVQAAIDAAPESQAKPWLIFIKEGTYNEHVDIPADKPYIHLIGQGHDKVFITDNRLSGGDNAVHVSIGATVVCHSDNLYFEGISFVNSYGKETNSGPQALALNTIGDRNIFNQCAMYSYQDTWITPSDQSARGYVKDCFIEGAVDFIYNGGDYFFDHDTLNIVRTSGGYIVAPNHDASTKWGYVFRNNVITAPGVPSETSVWLGRPWHGTPKTVFINTKAEVTIPATGWYETMNGLPAIWADYNTVDGDGNPLDLSLRRDTYYYTDSETGEKVYAKAKNHLTDEEAAAYTIENVLRSDDGWMPEQVVEACEAPAPTVNKTTATITWQAVPYAICYVITKDGKVVDFTTSTSCAYEVGSVYKVQAANEYGGLSKAARVTDGTTALERFDAQESVVSGIYGLDGKRRSTLGRGLNIVTSVGPDGHVTSRKVLVR